MVQDKDGDHETNIKVIRYNETSERSFSNKEYRDTIHEYINYKIGVVWEYRKIRGTRFLGFHHAHVWASNDHVNDETHSDTAMFGVHGQNAYPLGWAGVGRRTERFTFFEDGKPTGDYGTYFPLNEYDSIFLCIRSPPYPGWKAACQGYDVSFSWSWGK